MKKIKIALLVLVLCSFSTQLNAQDGYTYTLLDNGSYSFTVAAVPHASGSNFATKVQSYGFTILIPDGVTITATSSLGNAVTLDPPLDGSMVGMPAVDIYQISGTLGSSFALAELPSSGDMSDILTIQVNGAPISGDISLVGNDTALVASVPPLECFKNADVIDDSVDIFAPVVDGIGVGSGLSGTTLFSFSTLSNNTQELTSVSLYPNPTNGNIFIKGVNDLQSVEVMNVNGQRVMSFNSNLETINVNSLNSGVYFVKLETAVATKTIKLIKK